MSLFSSVMSKVRTICHRHYFVHQMCAAQNSVNYHESSKKDNHQVMRIITKNCLKLNLKAKLLAVCHYVTAGGACCIVFTAFVTSTCLPILNCSLFIIFHWSIGFKKGTVATMKEKIVSVPYISNPYCLHQFLRNLTIDVRSQCWNYYPLYRLQNSTCTKIQLACN